MTHPEQRAAAVGSSAERLAALLAAHGTPSPAPGGVSSREAADERHRRALAAPDDPPRRTLRPVREPGPVVRWAVAPRAAAVAALAVVLLAGGVVLRLTALRVGEPADLPEPHPVVAATAPEPAAVPDPDASSTPPADVLPAPTVTVAPAVVVHVVGQVAAPGLVTLPAGARVADAVAAAGGALPDADLAAVNLARVLVDAEQVVVPRPGESPVPAGVPAASPAGAPATGTATGSAAGGVTGAAGAAYVDLATASLAELDALPGIGPVLAQRIVDRRAERPFATVAELGDVAGIGPTLLARLTPLVTVGP